MQPMQTVETSRIAQGDNELKRQKLLFETAGRQYDRLKKVQNHALEYMIEERLNDMSNKLSTGHSKALVATTAALWVPTYVLARAAVTRRSLLETHSPARTIREAVWRVN